MPPDCFKSYFRELYIVKVIILSTSPKHVWLNEKMRPWSWLFWRLHVRWCSSGLLLKVWSFNWADRKEFQRRVGESRREVFIISRKWVEECSPEQGLHLGPRTDPDAQQLQGFLQLESSNVMFMITPEFGCLKTGRSFISNWKVISKKPLWSKKRFPLNKCISGLVEYH